MEHKSPSSVQIQLPKRLNGFFDKPARYRVLHGGRGSSKSWSVAQVLVAKAREKKRLILCARELQKSIKDSSHRLIAATIERLQLQDEFVITETSIRHKETGSEFIFKGLKYNADEIKSTEGISIAWVEEADRISRRSLQLLIPTVRQKDSEIWFTFNPNDEEDEVYQRFVIGKPPENSIVVEINWNHNPWFSAELEAERQYDKKNNPDMYEHIWNGKPQKALEGAYFAAILAEMRQNNLITEVPYNAEFSVNVYFDIGMSDYTTAWFTQKIGFRHHVIDYIQHSGEDLPFYANLLKGKSYRYGSIYLPHDAGHLRLGMAGRTVLEQMQQLMPKEDFVKLPPAASIQSDIMATRLFMKRCVFDSDKCEDGLRALRKYSKKWNDARNKFEDKPLHDEHSHGADAFRYFAIHNADERDIGQEYDYKKLDNQNSRIEAYDNDFAHSYF